MPMPCAVYAGIFSSSYGLVSVECTNFILGKGEPLKGKDNMKVKKVNTKEKTGAIRTNPNI